MAPALASPSPSRVVNDNALATTGRNLTTTAATPANGGITFSATALSSSQSSATASVAGGDEDDGSGSHSDNGSDQSVDNKTKKQSSFADSETSSAPATRRRAPKARTATTRRSRPTGRSASPARSRSTSRTPRAKAFIADGLTVTATGRAGGDQSAQVNAQAIASGAATATEGGTGVGLGVGINVANETNSAYIGNNTVISAGGLTVSATEAQRSVDLETKALPVVNVGSGETANSIFLGLGTGLGQGDGVKYDAEGQYRDRRADRRHDLLRRRPG